MKLRTERGSPVTIINFDQVRNALSTLDENGNSFAILDDEPRFIQTAINDSAMVVEKNDGSLDRHFRATRNGSGDFTPLEAESMFRAFYERRPMPSDVRWEKVELKAMPRWLYRVLWALPWIAIAWIGYRAVSGGIDLWRWLR